MKKTESTAGETAKDGALLDRKDSAFEKELAACLVEKEEVEGHLTTAEIFAYLGDDGETNGDRLREHLVACSRCLQDLLAAADLSSPVENLESLDFFENLDFEVAAAWRALRERLRVEDLKCALDEARRKNSEFKSRWRAARLWGRTLLAAAACVFLVLGVLTRRAYVERWNLEQPQLNALIEDVVVPAERTRGVVFPVQVEVPADISMVTLVFPLLREKIFASHRVEIVAEDGQLMWNAQGVLHVDAGTWNLGVPRSFLEAGKYQVRLLGLDADKEPEELGDYQFELVLLD
jgi:hypothetical protein